MSGMNGENKCEYNEINLTDKHCLSSPAIVHRGLSLKLIHNRLSSGDPDLFVSRSASTVFQMNFTVTSPPSCSESQS